MENKEYDLLTAAYDFSCPVCGTYVRRGDNYVMSDGVATCLCVMPVRNLKPLNPEGTDVPELQKALKHLRIQNLKMRLDFEVLIDHPEGKAAKKILAKYRRMRTVRNERLLSTQN